MIVREASDDPVRLYAPAFFIIGEKYALDMSASFYEDDDDPDERSDIAIIESVAHDMAHALVFGIRFSSRELSNRIAKLPWQLKTDHEVVSIAVEIRGLVKLGIYIDENMLIEYAADKAFLSNREMARDVANAMLSNRVDILVEKFIAWVKESS